MGSTLGRCRPGERNEYLGSLVSLGFLEAEAGGESPMGRRGNKSIADIIDLKQSATLPGRLYSQLFVLIARKIQELEEGKGGMLEHIASINHRKLPGDLFIPILCIRRLALHQRCRMPRYKRFPKRCKLVRGVVGGVINFIFLMANHLLAMGHRHDNHPLAYHRLTARDAQITKLNLSRLDEGGPRIEELSQDAELLRRLYEIKFAEKWHCKYTSDLKGVC
jgi:hypothetical protein